MDPCTFRVVVPKLRLALGGLDLLLRSSDGHLLRFEGEECYRSFVSPASGAVNQGTSIDIQLTVVDRPIAEGRLILESSATWSVLAQGPERVVVFRFLSDPSPVIVVRHELGSSRLFVQCAPRLLEGDGRLRTLDCSLLRYPLDQILSMYLLADRGFILHAAGALVRGQGIVVSGVSGAGKTTFARLASGRPGWEPLSDDRVILTRAPNVSELHGTPWPGEGRIAENRSGPLQWLLFLEQGDSNVVRPLTPREAIPRLFQTASLPWFDAVSVGNGLKACEGVLEGTRCGVLTFRPDAGAVDAVEALLEA